MTQKVVTGGTRGTGLNQQGLVDRNEYSSEFASNYNRDVKGSGKQTPNSITYQTNVIKSINRIVARTARLESEVKTLEESSGHTSEALAQKNILYVSTDGDDTTGDGSIGKEFLTIQTAIIAASPGDSVSVYPGVYAGTVDVNKVIRLEAENASLGSTLTVSIAEARVDVGVVQGNVVINAANVILNADELAGQLDVNANDSIIRANKADIVNVAVAVNAANINIGECEGVLTIAGDSITFTADIVFPGAQVTGTNNNLIINNIDATGLATDAITISGVDNKVEVIKMVVETGSGFVISGAGGNEIKFGTIDVIGATGIGIEPTGNGNLIFNGETITLSGANSIGIGQTNAAVDLPDIQGSVDQIYLMVDPCTGINLTSAGVAIVEIEVKLIEDNGAANCTATNIITVAGNTIQFNGVYGRIDCDNGIIVDGGTEFHISVSSINCTLNFVTQHASDVITGYAIEQGVGTNTVFAGSYIIVTEPGGSAIGTAADRPAATVALNGLTYFNTDIQTKQIVVDGAWSSIPRVQASLANTLPSPNAGDIWIDTTGGTPRPIVMYDGIAWIAI